MDLLGTRGSGQKICVGGEKVGRVKVLAVGCLRCTEASKQATRKPMVAVRLVQRVVVGFE